MVSLNASQQRIAASVVKYFQGQGYTKEQACGIAGNMFVESRFNIGAVNPNDVGKQSIGLCQWRAERNQNLRSYAQKAGKQWTSLDVQLGFTSWELNNYEKKTPPFMKQTSTPQQAALMWAKKFERCSSASYTERQQAAQAIFNGVSNNGWQADGTLESDDTGEGVGEEETPTTYDTVDNDNTNMQDAPAINYSQEANKASNSNGDFVQLTGFGVDWENDDSLIVLESEPFDEDGGTSNYQAMNRTAKGVKPPTLKQYFKTSISVSEHSDRAAEDDNSQQHTIDSGGGSTNPPMEEMIDSFAV